MKLFHAAVTAAVLGATTAVTANADTFPSFVGQLVPADSAGRTIVIDPATRWVNVTQGEKVKFLANGREFVIDFDGVDQSVDLRKLAPEGVLDHQVETYVRTSPFNLPN
jgi:hypothetical protein